MSRSLISRKASLVVGLAAALVLVIAGVVTFYGPFKANAAGGVTLYVGHTSGNNASCSSPGFTSVQAAVNVANTGDIVYLCGTLPYYEQVIITKSITLKGDAGATIEAPTPFPTTPLSSLPPQFTSDNLFVPQAIVFIWGTGVKVNIKGLTITGVMPGNGGCAEDEFGVLAIDGAKVTLNNDKVLNIQDVNPALYGCQFGVGVQIGRQYWPKSDFSSYVNENFVGYANIIGTTVTGYQKNGIDVDGLGSTASVSKNTVSGAGRNNGNLFSPIIAQNGIEIGRGASAQVMYNIVSGNSYTGNGGASDGGILVFGGACYGSGTSLTTNTLVEYNTLQDNDIGAYISNLNVDSNNNCALPSTPTSIQVFKNHITNTAASNVSGYNNFNYPGGYQAGVSDEGYADKITSNQICGVGYTPLATPPPYLSQIDVEATNPIVTGNTTCTISTISAPAKSSKPGRIHSSAKPFK